MWFAVSDDLDSNRKWERLWDITTEAEWCRCVALWTFCGSWCAGAMSDGEVSLERAHKLVKGSRRKVERAADQLVEVGLWEVVSTPKGSPKGSPKRFHFVHHSDHNPTRKQIELRKQKSRQSTEKHRATRRNHSTGDQSRDVSRAGHVIGHSRARVTPTPTPTPIQSSPSARPPFDPPVEPVALPLFGDEQRGAQPPPAAAGSSPPKRSASPAKKFAMADDWAVSASLRDWATDPAGGKSGKGPRLTDDVVDTLVPEFRDHWIRDGSKTTARGWDAAFRTWCRNHNKGYGQPRNGRSTGFRAGDAGMAPGTYQQSQPDEDNLPWRQTAI